MTKDEDFKALVRARMGKTGESYTTARRQILADSPSWTDANSGDLAERVDALETKVEILFELLKDRGSREAEAKAAAELHAWDPPAGVSRQDGELMFRCSICAAEARGFASFDTAIDALKSHFRESGHTGPHVLFTEHGFDTIGPDETVDPKPA